MKEEEKNQELKEEQIDEVTGGSIDAKKASDDFLL